MQIIALIQARMGSTRLPGKVLMDIGGKPMLGRVVERVKRSNRIVETVVVTSTAIQDNEIVDFCQASGVLVFRGEETDVLDRYYRAAKKSGAETIVRITADCPFIDPEVIDEVISAFEDSRADYASNTLERTFPHGLDVEVFSFSTLSEAAHEAEEDYQRTHVTPFIYEHPELFRLYSLVATLNFAHYRLTVDQTEDLEFTRALYEKLNNRDTFGYMDAISILESAPHMAAINRDVQQKGLYDL